MPNNCQLFVLLKTIIAHKELLVISIYVTVWKQMTILNRNNNLKLHNY